MKTRSGRYLCRCPTPLDYYNLFEDALVEFDGQIKQWVCTLYLYKRLCYYAFLFQVKMAFQYVLELAIPDVEFCKITSCAKAALVLHLIRYILKKKCDCDPPNYLCEHRLMQVWTPRLARVTKCPQTAHFLTGVHKYAEVLINLGGACAIYCQQHGSPVPFSVRWPFLATCIFTYLDSFHDFCIHLQAAFNKYMYSVAMDPKLTQLTMEDFAF